MTQSKFTLERSFKSEHVMSAQAPRAAAARLSHQPAARRLIRRLEEKINSRVVGLLIRTFLNPTRSFAKFVTRP
jgi:hypothetical protein